MKKMQLFTALLWIGFSAAPAAADGTAKRSVATAPPAEAGGARYAIKEQKCAKQARRALLQNAQLTPEDTSTDSSFVFVNGAMVGDAGISVEIDVYSNKDTDTYSKVELDGEMCTLRSIEILQ